MSSCLKKRKEFLGEVDKISSKDTVAVIVKARKAHPLYRKVLNYTKRYLVHVSNGFQVHKGDIVKIVSSRPISKRKSFYLSSVIKSMNTKSD